MFESFHASLENIAGSVSKLFHKRRKQSRRRVLRESLQLESLEYRSLMAGDVGQDIIAFAKALNTSGAKFYGADWCPFCREQKDLFGAGEAFLPFVEVTNPNRSFNSTGTSKNITTMPTWEFANGTRLTGVQSLQSLATAAGLTIGSNSDPTFNALGATGQVLANNATITVKAGAPLWIPLDGFDPTNDDLTYEVISSNTNVVTAQLSSSADESARISYKDFGDIVVRLFTSRVPRAVGQFTDLADSGFYDSTGSNKHIVHRVASSNGSPFVIQMGDPTNDNGTGDSSLPDFDDQFDLDLAHTRTGILSWAKSGDDTNNSQFFITAADPRFLDFNHSVFGVVVEGEAVRAGIQRTAVGANDKPTTDVEVETVETFTDTQNSAFLLKAIAATGTSQITVRVRDTDNNVFEQTYTVNVVADDTNTAPFLADIPALTGQAGVATTHQLVARDAENDTAITYTATVVTPANGTASVSSTGLLTMTPAAGFTGVMQVRVNAKQTSPTAVTSDTTGDTQIVRLSVGANAPGAIDLDAEDDTGASATDNVTNSPFLRFTVSGVKDGATVKLFSGSDEIAVATATGTTAAFSVDPAEVDLQSGQHILTAKQTIDGVESAASAAFTLNYDTTMEDITPSLPTSAFGNVLFTFNPQHAEEGQQGFVYSLVEKPTGMTINPSTGEISWTPTADQEGFQSVTIKATDLAGNETELAESINVEATRYAEISAVPVNASGTVLTTIPKGTDFFLEIRIRDIRPDAAGIESAFVDVDFDSRFATITGAVTHGSYTIDAVANTSTAGKIDEAGGKTNANGNGSSTQTLLRIPMRSSKAGTLTFDLSEAQSLNGTVRLAVSSGSQTELLGENIQFKNATLTVQASFTLANDSFNANENTSNQSLNVLANDTPGSGDVLTIVDVTDPNKNGTVTIASDGKTLNYTPDGGFSGEETFSYTVRNQDGDEATATVTMTVADVNNPPVATNDTQTVVEDAAFTTINVLANDNTGNDQNETLSVTAVGTTNHGGTVELSGSLAIRYKPAANFFGVETFTYTISDGRGGTATATVNVTVTEVNDAPALAQFTQTVAEESAEVELNISSVFPSNPDNSLTQEVLTITGKTDPANGTLRLENGKLFYKPNANFQGTDNFTYTVTDARGLTATNSGSVTVTNSNDPPTAANDTATTTKNTPVTISVLANDSANPDPVETLTVTTTTTPANGTAVIDTATNTIRYTPNTDFVGSDTFSYTIRDAGGATATANVNVTITKDAPSTIVGFVYNDTNRNGLRDINEPGLGNVEVVLTSEDDSSEDPINKTAKTDSSGRYEFSDLPLGKYTIEQTQPETLVEGNATLGSGTGSVLSKSSVQVNISQAGTQVSEVNFSELGRQPQLFRIFELFGSSRKRSRVQVALSSDGSGTSWTQTTNTPWSSFKSVDLVLSEDKKKVTVRATDSNNVPFTSEVPIGNAANTVRLIEQSVTSEDGEGEPITSMLQLLYLPNDPATLNLKRAANAAPSFTKGADQTVNEDAAAASIDNWATAISKGADFESDQTLTFTVTVDKPELFTSVPAVDATGKLTYTVAPNANGTAIATVKLKDNGGTADSGKDESAAQTFNIVINAVNDVPTFTVGANQTVARNAAAQTVNNFITNGSAGPTNESSQTLTYEIRNTTNTQLFTTPPAISPAGVLTYTPAQNQSGTSTVTVRLKDSGGTTNSGVDTSAEQTFTITIGEATNPNNRAPVAGDDTATTNEDAPVTITVATNDSDPDGNTLTKTVSTTPTNGTTVINTDGTITYTPSPNFNGVDSFVYTVNDGNGGTDTATVNITVNAVNDAPSFNKGENITVAKNSAAFVKTGWATSISRGPTNEATQTLSAFEIVSNSNAALFASGGAPAITNGGTLTFQPAANQTGTATITISLKDNGGTANGGTDTSVVQSFTITLNDVANAPVAGDDTSSTNEDTAVTVNVGNNDSDPNGDALTRTVTTQPQHGTATVNNTGTITYTPAANFNGTDTFVYTLNDGNGNTDTATVTITVNAVNDAPITGDDTISTNEDTAVDITVAINDSDVDGNTLTRTVTTAPLHGTATVNVNGTIKYTPAANFSGSDSFVYTANDGNGGTDTATVTITVTAVNDAPVAGDDSISTNEDTQVDITVATNDTDVEGNTLTRTITTAPTHGTASVNVNGTIRYTPDANFNGTDTFVYTANDGNGGTDTATVTVTVTAVNDIPVAGDDSTTTPEDTDKIITVVTNDSDADGDTLTYSVTTPPAHGTATVNVDKTITYNPDANFNGTDTFVYAVNDGNGGTDTATVTITVTSVNNAPVAGDDTATTNEDTEVTIDAKLNDSDGDGDTLTYTVGTDVAHGTLTNNNDGTFKYVPDANFNGTDSFTYTVNDGHSGTDTATVNITITVVNDAPIAGDDTATTDEDLDKIITVLTNDNDADGDTLTVTIAGNPSHGSAVVNVDKTITYSPDPGFHGTDSFTYTISDGTLSDTATVSLTINSVNTAPTAVNDPATLDEDTDVTIDVAANDSDPDNDTLTFAVTTQPTHGDVLNNNDGTFTYTPDANYFGSDSFTYTVDDGNGGSATATVNITVNGVNDDPIANDDTASGDEDTDITKNVLANDTDADNDTLTVTISTDPSFGTAVVNGDKTITFTPDPDFFGTDSLEYTIDDGNGGVVTAILDITVNGVNDAPTITAAESDATTQNVDLVFNDIGLNEILINDVDADVSDIEVTLTITNGTVALNDISSLTNVTGDGSALITLTGSLSAIRDALNGLTFTPTTNFTGNASIEVDVTDLGNTGSGGALTDNALVTITVT